MTSVIPIPPFAVFRLILLHGFPRCNQKVLALLGALCSLQIFRSLGSTVLTARTSGPIIGHRTTHVKRQPHHEQTNDSLRPGAGAAHRGGAAAAAPGRRPALPGGLLDLFHRHHWRLPGPGWLYDPSETPAAGSLSQRWLRDCRPQLDCHQPCGGAALLPVRPDPPVHRRPV